MSLRTLHVITRLTLGGSAENTLATMLALEAAGYAGSLAVGVAASDAASVNDARRRGATLHDVPGLGREVGPRDAAALVRLWRLMRAQQPAIVHTHTSKAGFIGRLSRRGFARRYANPPLLGSGSQPTISTVPTSKPRGRSSFENPSKSKSDQWPTFSLA